jgi:glycosyltransferase involved in cell wall biosynthesis
VRGLTNKVQRSSSVLEDIEPEYFDDARETRSLHVLLSAFACEPDEGSEPGVGWNWVKGLSAWCRVSAITRTSNRGAIEARLEQEPLQNVRFYYQDLPRGYDVPERSLVGQYLIYALWQYCAYRLAGLIYSTDPFDLAHHVTYCSLPGPVFMHRLPVPFIFGPVAGGETMPSSFVAGGGFSSLAYEFLRALRQRSIRWDPMVQSTIAQAAHILAATPETAGLIPSRHRAKVSLLTTSGLEPDLVPPVRDDERSGQEMYVGGRLLHWKGFHLVIQAFARVSQKYPAAKLSIFGDGPRRRALEQLVHSHGLSDRVRFMGWLPLPEFLRMTQRNDIFLHPALHCSDPGVMYHAMAAEQPVICLDAPGPRMVVTPECGFTIPMNSVEQVVAGVAAAMERLLSDAELRRRMGHSGRKRVLEEFLWDKRAAMMIGLYRQVLNVS